VANRKDPEESSVTIDGVDDAETPDAVFPEPLQFPQEGFPQGRIATERLQCALDRPLQLWWKMAKDFRHVRRYVEAIDGH
jgi:hypothetical protein